MAQDNLILSLNIQPLFNEELTSLGDSPTDARIGELLRLQLLLDGPSLSLDKIRTYVGERLQVLYPLDYHVYRRRWEQLASGVRRDDANWPKLNYLEWRQAVDALVEGVRLAEIMAEAESLKVREWRSMLMVGPEWEN